jgi:hypothetical protein
LLWLLLVAVAAINCQAALKKFGAMGDSLSDEYWDSGVATYSSNWVSLLVAYRSIDFGPTAAEAGVGNWGEPRNYGFQFNWARSGANSSTLLTQGQQTGLAAQVPTGVSNVVLAIGCNDFNPGTTPYFNIYNGFWGASSIQSYVNQSISNIESALIPVRAAGASVVLANIIDPGITPLAGSLYSNAGNRDRVAAAVQSVNNGLKTVAQKYQVPLMDWYGLAKTIIGPNTNLHATCKIGNVVINLRGSDSGGTPTNGFVSDGFHPNTVIQGVFANVILQAFASGYGSDTGLFSEQEILTQSGIAYGGSDSLPNLIGAYSNYILLPIRPNFTAIQMAGTNVTMKFSTASNQLYRVERSDDLASGSWVVVTNNLSGNGGQVSVTNPVSAGWPKRFYRVRQLP